MRHLTNGEDKPSNRGEEQPLLDKPKDDATPAADDPAGDGQGKEDGATDREGEDTGSPAAAKKPPLAVADYQLYEALNVLRALTLFTAPRANPAAPGVPQQP